MTSAQMRAWRARLGCSRAAAAVLLGMSERALANYEGGERRIPRVVELACERVETMHTARALLRVP
jgi:transcriptional regulator with XRE-family HTH domain